MTILEKCLITAGILLTLRFAFLWVRDAVKTWSALKVLRAELDQVPWACAQKAALMVGDGRVRAACNAVENSKTSMVVAVSQRDGHAYAHAQTDMDLSEQQLKEVIARDKTAIRVYEQVTSEYNRAIRELEQSVRAVHRVASELPQNLDRIINQAVIEARSQFKVTIPVPSADTAAADEELISRFLSN